MSRLQSLCSRASLAHFIRHHVAVGEPEMSMVYDEARCMAACEYVARKIVAPMLRQYRQGPQLATTAKPDKTLVTDADKAIENRVTEYLGKEFPSYGLLGEEWDPKKITAEYVWVIDPLDGTEAFVARVSLFGTQLALIHQRDDSRIPILGAMYLPTEDVLLLGNRNQTTVNGRPERMPRVADPSDRCLLLGDLAEIVRRVPSAQHAKLLALVARHRTAQSWDGCLGYLNMLRGYAQVQISAGLGVEDIAPLEPIVLGASGHVSDLDGRSLTDILSSLKRLDDKSACFSSVAAVNSEVHGAVMRSLAEPDCALVLPG